MGRFRKSNYSLSNQARRRRWHKVRPLVFRVINGSMFVCFCYGLYLFNMWLYKPTTFPLNNFKITTDAEYVKPAMFSQWLKKDTHAGFFSFDIQALKVHLLKNQWVRDVSIRKVFPHTLVVDIKERKPTAYWNKRGVVDRHNKIFYPQQTLALSLPRFIGDKAHILLIQQRYAELSPLFFALNTSVNQVSYSVTGGWVLQLNNGIELHCGNKDVVSRCQRFIEAYPQLKQTNKHIQSVDLRYPSGFAVRWVDNRLTNHV